MARSLLDYHFLEDGELNRLWYEENDARARDAFMQRWWLGGDPVAGKDLLSHYHTPFMHRCYERGLLAEEHMTRAFRAAVKLLVATYPADPIEKFEDVWLPFVDRGISSVVAEIAGPSAAPAAEQKKKLEDTLKAEGARGDMLRRWLTTGALGDGALGDGALGDNDAAFEDLLDTGKRVLIALDGEGAKSHPLVRTPEPEPSKLDPSVAVPHFHAKPLFQYAFQGGSLSKRENEHIDWCQPCRQRCLGALLLLRRIRVLLGGDLPKLPEISPEFDQILQSESPGVPVIDRNAKSAKDAGRGGSLNLVVVAIVVLAIVAIIVVVALKKG